MIRVVHAIQAAKGFRRQMALMAAGMLAALALPPLGLWPLLPVAFGVLATRLEAEAAAGWRRHFAVGWLFGLGYFAVAFHWIGFAFAVDAGTYLWMMPFMLGALAGGMAIYWGLAATLAARLGGAGLGLVLALAAMLGAAEWLRGHLFTGFPWAAPGLMGDGMGGLAQAAALVGMTGLSVLIVLWAGLAGVALLRTGSERAVALLLLGALPVAWVFGEWRLSAAVAPGDGALPLRIVQPNIAQDQKWREDNARSIFDTLKRLSTQATALSPGGIAGVGLLVWPESAVPFFIDESQVAQSELKPLLAGATALVTGALRRDRDGAGEGKVYNSVIVFDGMGLPVARYDKWRLVPGGEFLPFAWLLEPLGFRKVVTVPGSFAAGPGPVALTIPGGPEAAALICYEVIFPHRLLDPTRRPGFIINVTNDGWFGRSTGPHQHLAQARLRAIEQGLPVVRAANTGISAVIDGHGRILARLGLFEAGVIDAKLPAALPPTVYARWGDSLTLLLIALLAAAAFICRQYASARRQAGAS